MVRNNWYKLDNVGKFYSFTNKNKIPAVFRYSVSLKEVIDEEILQNALNDILKYFPNFNCHLKKGIFWYYLENSNKIVEVKKENEPIYSKIYKDEDDVLFRVSHYKKRINFEFSHILSDGRGSLIFFKSLIYQYLILKEKLADIELDVDSSIFEKNEDSFDKYYTKEKIKIPKGRKIYQYKGKKKNTITYMEYHISTKETLELAHKYNASLTALLTPVLICSYQEIMKELELNKSIKIDIPVDLRQFFKSSTSKNFFGLTSVTYKFDSKNYDFADVIHSVNSELQKNVTTERLKIRMNQFISLEKNVFARFVPIFIKDIILKIADLISSTGCTSCLSNIGAIKVDEKLERYIENFNVLNASESLKLTICSFKDDLSIGISSKYVNNDIVKNFCRFFKESGINGVMNISEEEI